MALAAVMDPIMLLLGFSLIFRGIDYVRIEHRMTRLEQSLAKMKSRLMS
jgi:hypothetical protein